LPGSRSESQPWSTAVPSGNELDATGLEGALELQEGGEPYRKKALAELKSLDRGKRYARLLGEFSLCQADHGSSGPELLCIG
jgi:hypothetical protein